MRPDSFQSKNKKNNYETKQKQYSILLFNIVIQYAKLALARPDNPPPQPHPCFFLVPRKNQLRLLTSTLCSSAHGVSGAPGTHGAH